MSYDMIDRFLRNNLGDDDYAEYSAALDSLCTPQPKQEQRSDSEHTGEPDDLTIAYMAGLNRGKDLAPQPAPQRSEDTTQKKPWVGLTDEQIYEIHENSSNLMEFTRAIEAAHGIKDNT